MPRTAPVAWAHGERDCHAGLVELQGLAIHLAGMGTAEVARMATVWTDRRRLLDKLLRELVRAEALAIEHAPREAKRIGEAPPVQALRDVAAHALCMRPRFAVVIDGHSLAPARGGIGTTLTTLRQLVTDRIHDAERAYRGALLDIRHGLDVVRVMREVARHEELFALIRWCDDWLVARRTLVARVEAQLEWFAAQPASEPQQSSPQTSEDTNPALFDFP